MFKPFMDYKTSWARRLKGRSRSTWCGLAVVLSATMWTQMEKVIAGLYDQSSLSSRSRGNFGINPPPQDRELNQRLKEKPEGDDALADGHVLLSVVVSAGYQRARRAGLRQRSAILADANVSVTPSSRRSRSRTSRGHRGGGGGGGGERRRGLRRQGRGLSSSSRPHVRSRLDRGAHRQALRHAGGRAVHSRSRLGASRRGRRSVAARELRTACERGGEARARSPCATATCRTCKGLTAYRQRPPGQGWVWHCMVVVCVSDVCSKSGRTSERASERARERERERCRAG